jgi:hypothetical protein
MNARRVEIRRVPMYDTGLGREAGYANDQELIEAGERQRAELETLLTSEALAKMDAAEAEMTRRFLFGRTSA